MYRYESWIMKKAEPRRTDAFELWCWRRLLKVLWTARRSNQSILKEISPEYSLEGLTLKLKLQYWCKEPTRWKRPWCWERFRAGEGGDRGWDGWIESSTKWTWVWANSRRQWRIGKPGVLLSTGSQNQTWPNDCTTTLTLCFEGFCWLYVLYLFIYLTVSGLSYSTQAL